MAASSVNILLTARDEASPAINKAARSTDQLSSSMRKTGESSGGLGASMLKVAGPLAVVAGGFLAAKAAASAARAAFNSFTALLGDSIEAFATQEAAMQGNSKELQDYASQLQNATNVGDEVILKAMQMARGMGVQDDSMKQVTQSAIALSRITGKSLERSMKAMAQASLGGTEALEEMLPALKSMTDEEERQAYITQQLGEGWNQVSGESSTLKGALTALGNTWGDILEQIGSLLAPFITKLSDWFKRIGPIIGGVIAQALPMMQEFAMKMQELAIWIGEKLVYAFTFVEQAALNWQDVMTLAVLIVYGKIVKFVEDTKHFFTTALPEYIKWFADNFINIMRDAMVAYTTMWINRIQQAIDAWNLLWDVISGKKSVAQGMIGIGEIAGRSLLEGFVATTEALPEIAERQLTLEEKAISSAYNAYSKDFTDKVDKAFNERMKFFKEDVFGVDFKMNFKGTEGLDLETLKTKKEREKEKGAGKGPLQAEEGRLLTRGRVTVEQQQLQAQEKMAINLEKLKELQEQLLAEQKKEKQEPQSVDI